MINILKTFNLFFKVLLLDKTIIMSNTANSSWRFLQWLQ